ncbi:putative ammonium transporter 1 isoform X1 [Clavelina lepadiformis]|uniref:putative ammonium transporter 1 isoform X1 n=1 Tax=Clavelina lepadiformis TaxID=159417 RepID=UPI004041DDC9
MARNQNDPEIINSSLIWLKTQIDVMKENNNEVFLILTGMFIFLMQCGFAFLEAGSVQKKNTINILVKNILDSFIGSIAFWGFGYALAYGVPGNGFIGHHHFFSTYVDYFGEKFSLQDTTNSNATVLPISSNAYFANWFFQYVFAATAATIVSGAMAERAEFVCYIVYSFTITGFIYPVVAHWVWSPYGWLKSGVGTDLFMQDFAGSSVVHICGGVAALVGAKLVGPRLNRFSENGEIKPIPGHSVPLTALGAFILLVGFLCFNGGSVQRVSEKGDSAMVAMSVMNTILAGSAGGLVAMVTDRIYSEYKGKESYWSLLITINGALTGMVASCAGCNDIAPWAAIVIGSMGGLEFTFGKRLLIRFKIDDPLDAVPVHFGGGLTGTILTPIFALRGQNIDGKPVGGIIFGAHKKAFMGLGWNLIGCCGIILWTFVCSFTMFYTLQNIGLIRISQKIEKAGMDIKKHGQTAYPDHNSLQFVDEAANASQGNLERKPQKSNNMEMIDLPAYVNTTAWEDVTTSVPQQTSSSEKSHNNNLET